MFYMIYQITNNINNKIYIGVHKTENLDDGYMGSGLNILRALDKYGKDNFTKEILELCPSEEAMYEREAEIVNYEFILREDTYNLATGGFGGWKYDKKGENHPMFGKEHPSKGKTDLFHLSDTAKGKISSNKRGTVNALDLRDGSRKWVTKEDFDQYDYYVGQTMGYESSIKNKKAVRKNGSFKFVSELEVDTYLEAGWELGIYREKIKCPHCDIELYKQNLKRHIKARHKDAI